MALTEELVIDKIEVDEHGVVHVRTATRIFRDGTKIAEAFHRSTIAPNADLANQPARVRVIAAAAWTPEAAAAPLVREVGDVA